MITMLGRFTSKPEKREELAQTLNALMGEIQGQPGCLGCLLSRESDPEDGFVLSSTWRNRATLEEHLRSEQVSILLGTSGLMQSAPDFWFSDEDLAGGGEFIDHVRRKASTDATRNLNQTGRGGQTGGRSGPWE